MLAEDSDETLPENGFVAKCFKEFLISFLPILCLLVSRRCSSLATYPPKMSSASPPSRVSFKVFDSSEKLFPQIPSVQLSLIWFC